MKGFIFINLDEMNFKYERDNELFGDSRSEFVCTDKDMNSKIVASLNADTVSPVIISSSNRKFIIENVNTIYNMPSFRYFDTSEYENEEIIGNVIKFRLPINPELFSAILYIRSDGVVALSFNQLI